MRADDFATCDVFVAGKAVDVGDKTVQKVPCMIKVTGQKELINILQMKLRTL